MIFQCIDIYCERTSCDFWAEPLNAVTNFVFMILAIVAFRNYMKTFKPESEKIDKNMVFLIFLVFSIGVGSFLFHTFANELTLFFDVFPIMLFAIWYFAVGQIKVLKFKLQNAAIGIIIFICLLLVMGRIFPRGFLNGSATYFPFPMACIFFASMMYKKNQAIFKQYCLATVAFCIAITCRIIDMELCPYIPFGTHFIWHTFTAITAYLLVNAMITSLKEK
ncbi:MAG: ceramidase [archaeon]|nr:ceramidase [archaeon]